MNGGLGNQGTCSDPGSSDPNHCCTCTWRDCQGCLDGYPDCASACQAGGHAGGYCAVPTSTDVTQCCACTD